MIACLFMVTGCVEEFEADLPDRDTHLLVVNGTICSNQLNKFQLTWSSPLNDKNLVFYGDGSDNYYYAYAEPVVGAKVTICGTDGKEYRCTAQYGSDAGNYTCDLPELNPDVSYYVTIEYADDIYQSTPEKPIYTPDIESFEYFQKDSLSNIDVLLTTAASDDPDKITYFVWDYDETWEVRPTRTTTIFFDVKKREKKDVYNVQLYPKFGWKFGYNDNIIVESTQHYAGGKLSKRRLLEIPRDDERIAWNYSNKVSQRAISKAEYEYEMACRQAGWEMGGLFTPQPSALPTNIRCLTSSNRVIGYVGCAQNVVTKRLYIEGSKISRVLPKPAMFIKLERCTLDECCQMVKNRYVIYKWYEDSDQTRYGLITYWGWLEDFDVREQGAITDKPEYMPPFGEEYHFEDSEYKYNYDYNDEEDDNIGDDFGYYDDGYYDDYYDTYSKSRRKHRN